MYLGVAGEKPSTTKAVADTAGEVVLYGGKVATTYYFSSSGGKTASAADVFGFAVPYLVSRPDPWDKLSPYFRWGPVLLGARTLQSKLGTDARVIDARGVGTPSGRLRALTLETVDGTDQIPASLLRTALGLRSTWLTMGVLRLDRPSRGAVVFGTSTRLSGIGRGFAALRLASSPDGSSWTPLLTVAPGCRRRGGRRRHSHPDHALPPRGGGRRVAGAARPGRSTRDACAPDAARAGRLHGHRPAQAAGSRGCNRAQEGDGVDSGG
jgi:stage II sporulation protein D